MRSIFLLSLFALALNSCSTKPGSKYPHYFEGNIKFRNAYEIKTDKVSAEYLDKLFGKTADLYFKEGNYLELYDSGFMLEQLYRKADDKYYIKKNAGDTLSWYDCTQPGQAMLEYKVNRKKETILGIECDEYITYYNNKTVTFYYNSDTLKINPEWYSRFTLTNKNINTERMKAMYLKFKIEYPDFLFTVTATSINPMKINDTLFKLNPKSILINDNK